MTEQQIQTKIVRWCKENNLFVNKNISCSVNGWPDLVVIDPADGHHLYIEVKDRYGRLSKIQEHIHKRLKIANCEVITVRSLEEVKEYYEQ